MQEIISRLSLPSLAILIAVAIAYVSLVPFKKTDDQSPPKDRD